MWVFYAQLFLQFCGGESFHDGSRFIFEIFSESIVQRSDDARIWILIECNGVEVGVQVDGFAIDGGNFDQVAAQISSFIGEIEHVSIV